MIELVPAAGPLDLSGRAVEVGPRLLGATITCGSVSLLITEIESYEGLDDPASHAWRGITPRSAIMFGPPGHAYVYLSHGIHHAMNLVCGPDGTASAVLLRAGRVVAGLDDARARRPGVGDDQLSRLARGPGNLTRALGVDLSHNGEPIVVLAPVPPDGPSLVRARSGPRVGVSRAADRPWRFWLADEPSVSAYRRSRRAPQPGTSHWDA